MGRKRDREACGSQEELKARRFSKPEKIPNKLVTQHQGRTTPHRDGLVLPAVGSSLLLKLWQAGWRVG